jgi:energy-coupling factor transporter ATP-binding protein EcfA2
MQSYIFLIQCQNQKDSIAALLVPTIASALTLVHLSARGGPVAKLLRVILIDSLCRGEIVEVKTDDNTCLTGTNGIGKSTFLKLIPLFYGAPAGRMVRKGTNTTSFADHYLPHASSYIVFEYENHEGALRSAILHRASNGYAYRLAATGWKPNLLYVNQGSGELVLPGKVGSRIQGMGIDCTPELSWNHYSKIIQYNTGSADMDGITDASVKKMINLFRRMYSLAPLRRNFAGIDSLMFSLLESKGTFDSMESAVGEIIRQETMRSEIDLSGIDVQSFLSAISNRASYLVMDREVKPKILGLATLRSRLVACDLQLGRLKTVAVTRQLFVKQEQEAVAAIMDAQRKQELAAQDASRDEQRQLDCRLGDARAASIEQLRLLKTLEDQKTGHDKAGMPALLAKIDNLPSMQEDLAAKREQLALLTSKSADIVSRFSAMERAAIDSLSSRRENRRGEAQGRLSEFDAQLRLHNEASEDAFGQAHKAHTEDLAQYERTRSELAALAASSAAEVAFLSRQKHLPDIAEQIDAEQTALAQLYELQEQTRKDLDRLDKEVAEIITGQQGLAAEMSGLARGRDDLRTEVKLLTARLNAADDTLLSFLRGSMSGWETTVGLVIDPRLLMREDLSPSLSAPCAGLFGLQLDLERLDPVDVLNLEELESQIARLNLRIEESNDAEEALSRRSAAAQVRRNTLREERIPLDSRTASIEADTSARKQRLESLRDEGAELLSTARAKAQESAEKAAIALSEKIAEIESLKAAFGRHKLELKSIADQARQDIATQRSSVEQALAAALADLERAHREEIERIEADRYSALKGAGIDAGAVRRLESTVNGLDQSVRHLVEQLPRIQDYRAWLETAWPNMAAREAAYAEAEQVVSRIGRDLQAMRTADEERQKAYKVRQAELAARNSALFDQAGALRSVLERLGQVAAASSGTESLEKLSAADIESEVGRIFRDAHQIKQEGRGLLRDVEGPFNSAHRATPEAGIVHDIIMRARHVDSSGERVWFYAAPELQMYIDDGHDVQRSKLVTYIRTLCNQLVEGGKILAEVDRTIQDVGRRATLQVSEVLGRFPDFTNFHLHVVSKIKDLKFNDLPIWEHIRAIEMQSARWDAMGNDAFPPDGLDHSLRMLHSAMVDKQWRGAQIEECFEVSLSWQVNGQPRVARNTTDLGDGLSTGQLKIVVGMIYLALFEMIRRDADFELIVPVDEALELEVNNAATLVGNFNSRNVKLMLGFPGGAPELMRHFKNLYALDRRRSGGVYLKEYRGADPVALDDLNAGLPEEEEVYA